MALLFKLVVAILAFLLLIFTLWVLFQIVMYFTIFMTGAVGLTNVSEYLKDFQCRTMTRVANVFRSKENKKSTESDFTKNKGKTL